MAVPKRSDAAIACAVFAVGFGLFFAFRGLGWFEQDEGVLYYHYLRTFHGQIPYRDFFTGYGPVTLYLHAGLFSIFGVSLDATRIVMAVVNALSGVFLYLVTRRVAAWPFAVVPALLFVTLQPGDIADMAFHNTPYPLWYLVMWFAMATWTMMRATEAGDRRAASWWLFVTGVIGGVALFTKQNGGIFLLWGATGFIASQQLATGGEPEGRFWRVARIAYLALIPSSMLFLIWTFLSPINVAAFIAPPAALAWIGATTTFSREGVRRALAAALWIALGVVVATLPWFFLFADTVGAWGFVKALFFWGKYVDRQLYLAFPMPGQLAAFLMGAVALTWYSGATLFRYRGRVMPAWVRPSLAVSWSLFFAITAGFLIYHAAEIRRLLYFEYNPWRMYQSSSIALDSALAYLIFPVVVGGLLVARRQARGVERAHDPDPPAFLCLLWMAVCASLLYYPRMDAAHFVSAAVLLYSVGAVLVQLGADRIAQLGGGLTGTRWRRALLALTGAAVLFAANLKMAPKVYSLVMLRSSGEGFPLVATPQERYDYDRLHVYFPIYEKSHRLYHHAFTDMIAYVRETTDPDEPVFAFPAFPMLYFVSGRDNPTRQDYFLRNNVPFDEQVKLLATLEASGVRLIVVPSDENDYFVDVGRPFHDLVWAYIHEEYYLEKRFGPYDVWRRFETDAEYGEAGRVHS